MFGATVWGKTLKVDRTHTPTATKPLSYQLNYAT